MGQGPHHGQADLPRRSLFSGDIPARESADNVDVNLEGGEHQVDIDIYGAPEGDQRFSDLDFELASTGEHAVRDESGLDFLLDEPQRGVDDDPTREMDGFARTQETPTIESPHLHDRRVREPFARNSITKAFEDGERHLEQTAELALDELGLDGSDR